MSEEKRMIDLSQVKVIAVDGSEQTVDLSKDLASAFYQRAQNVEEATASMDLFKNGKCEYSDAIRNGILNLMNVIGTSWAVKQGVIKAIGE